MKMMELKEFIANTESKAVKFHQDMLMKYQQLNDQIQLLVKNEDFNDNIE